MTLSHQTQFVGTRSLTFGVLCFLLPVLAVAENSSEVIVRAAEVLKDLTNAEAGIPHNLLNRADCVIVLPSVKKAAFIVGDQYGKGVMVCRSGEDFNGRWGAPIMMQSSGGSFGLQAGGQGTDFVILVMNDKGARSLINGRAKLGSETSIAAGPVGRSAETSNTGSIHAQLLLYSRAHGVFGGVSLSATSLGPDDSGNKELYGRHITAEEIFKGEVSPPSGTEPLLAQLERESAGSGYKVWKIPQVGTMGGIGVGEGPLGGTAGGMGGAGRPSEPSQHNRPTPDLVNNELEKEYEAAVRAAKTGIIKYAVPAEMEVGKQINVAVRIYGPGATAESRESFNSTGAGKLKVVTFMLVGLTEPDNPSAFKIDEADGIHRGEQFVPMSGYAEWDWKVTPAIGGEQPEKLHVTADMVFRAELPSGLPIKTEIGSYDAVVLVKVKPWTEAILDWIGENWKDLLKYTLPSGGLTALLIYLLHRRSDKRKPAATEAASPDGKQEQSDEETDDDE